MLGKWPAELHPNSLTPWIPVCVNGRKPEQEGKLKTKKKKKEFNFRCIQFSAAMQI